MQEDEIKRRLNKSIRRKKLDLEFEMTEGNTSNKYKLDTLELKMENFFKIFSFNDEEK